MMPFSLFQIQNENTEKFQNGLSLTLGKSILSKF